MTRQALPRFPRFQSGASLLVVLILLLIMTLLGLAVLRSTSLEERMSANLRDRSLSFQSAEAALREGEQLAAGTAAPPAAGTGCVSGLCEKPAVNATDRWLDAATVWRSAANNVNADNVSTRATPSRFIVEHMGRVQDDPDCASIGYKSNTTKCKMFSNLYRITAQSTAAGRANVLLQSNYLVPEN